MVKEEVVAEEPRSCDSEELATRIPSETAIQHTGNDRAKRVKKDVVPAAAVDKDPEEDKDAEWTLNMQQKAVRQGNAVVNSLDLTAFSWLLRKATETEEESEVVAGLDVAAGASCLR